MVLLLILVLLAVVFFVVHRFRVVARGEHVATPPGVAPPPPPADHVPLSASDQVTRATRAAEGTHAEPQHFPRVEDQPL